MPGLYKVRTRPRRAGLGALAVTVALIFGALAPWAAMATTYPVSGAGYGIALSVRPGSIRTGQPVTFTGVVSPAYAGGRVRLQRLVLNRWRLIEVDREIGPGGQFSIAHVFGVPSYRGPTWLRICLHANAPLVHTCSAAFQVRIKRAAPRHRHYLRTREAARVRHAKHRRQLEEARLRHRRALKEARRRRHEERRQRAAREREARRSRRQEEARRRREERQQRTHARAEERKQRQAERKQHEEERRRKREESRKHQQ